MSERRAMAAEARADRRVTKTRRAVKDAPVRLILEKGYEAVTVQDIIDRADVGRSTFYAHFVDKDELRARVLSKSRRSHAGRRGVAGQGGPVRLEPPDVSAL